jgi:protein SCO1/2
MFFAFNENGDEAIPGFCLSEQARTMRNSLGWGVLLAAVGLASWTFLCADEADSPGVTEHVGQFIPGEVLVVDDAGATLRLADLVDRPVILALVYYSCEHICPQVLSALGHLASEMTLAPGTDYRIVTLSFDAADTPADAARAKKNYLKPFAGGLPAGSWSFLTASPDDIRTLTDAAGFRYEADSHGFIHPSVLVILAPGGRIAGYIHVSKTAYGVGYPVTFPAVGVATSLRRAADGQSEAPSPLPLLFCYPHEPEKQSGFYGLLSTLGAFTLAVMAGLFLLLFMASGRRRPRTGVRGS